MEPASSYIPELKNKDSKKSSLSNEQVEKKVGDKHIPLWVSILYFIYLIVDFSQKGFQKGVRDWTLWFLPSMCIFYYVMKWIQWFAKSRSKDLEKTNKEP